MRLAIVATGFALQPEAWPWRWRGTGSAGRIPCLVMATIGTTSSLAVDPVRLIAPIARAVGMWLHVDGAMAGSAAICPELRDQQRGLEHADSYVFNPHKWLFTTFDCSCFFVADRAPLIEALSILPDTCARGHRGRAVTDYRAQVTLAAVRARSLWLVSACTGRGLRQHVASTSASV